MAHVLRKLPVSFTECSTNSRLVCRVANDGNGDPMLIENHELRDGSNDKDGSGTID